MEYAEFALTDLGYVDGNGNPLVSIEGLDNQASRFRHLGLAGYPVGAVACYDATGSGKTLAVFTGTAPVGGEVIPMADVVDLLVVEYGWPEGTTLVEGVPVEPERAR